MRRRRRGRRGLGDRGDSRASCSRSTRRRTRSSSRTKLDATPCELRVAVGSLWVVTQSGKLDRVDPATGRGHRADPGRRASPTTSTYRVRLDLGHEPRGPHGAADRPGDEQGREDALVRHGEAGGHRLGGRLRSGSATTTATRCAGSTRRRIAGRGSRRGRSSRRWVAASGNTVWVSNTGSDSVSRIDAKRRKVDEDDQGGAEPRQPGGRRRQRLGAERPRQHDHAHLDGGEGRRDDQDGQNPAVIAGVNGEVWASMFDDGQVWRIKPS